jgi:hypothetical protein
MMTIDRTSLSSSTMSQSTPAGLNMVEIEIGVLRGQCLDRRIATPERLVSEITAWERQRNVTRAQVNGCSQPKKDAPKWAAPAPSQLASKRTRRKSHNPCATVLVPSDANFRLSKLVQKCRREQLYVACGMQPLLNRSFDTRYPSRTRGTSSGLPGTPNRHRFGSGECWLKASACRPR